MGRNKVQNKIGTGLQNEQKKVGNEWDIYNSGLQARVDQSRQKSDALFDETTGNYRKFLGASGFGTGGYTKPEGYYEPSAENIARLRGNGVYDEFAGPTGGINEDQRSLMRKTGNATIGSFYGNLKNEMTRQRAVQGGVDPGYDAQMAKLARDQGNATSDVATGTEKDILDRVMANRQWGAQGLTAAEQAVVDATQRGRMYAGDDAYRNRQAALGAIGGMADMQGRIPGQLATYEDQVRAGLTQGDVSRGAISDQLMRYYPWKPSFWREALGFGTNLYLGTLAGIGGIAGQAKGAAGAGGAATAGGA
jgi:hypothetical protein